MEEFLIDIGAAEKDDLSKAKVATEKKRKLRGEYKFFIVNLLLKLQERVPIQYALVRNPLRLIPTTLPFKLHPCQNDLFV